MCIAEIAQPDPGEPVARARGLADALAQRQRDLDELLFAGRRLRRRQAAGEDAEVAGLELEHDGAGDAAVVLLALAQIAGPGFFGEPTDMRFEFVEAQVVFESIFGGDLQGGALGDDWIFVDAERQFMQTSAPATEALFEIGRR